MMNLMPQVCCEVSELLVLDLSPSTSNTKSSDIGFALNVLLVAEPARAIAKIQEKMTVFKEHKLCFKY